MEKSDPRKTAETGAIIGGGVTVTGDVECDGELQIGGRIIGDVRCATLFIDEGGVVKGTIQAERVRLSGSVDGDIDTGDLAIESTGHASGTLTYARLKVNAGGVIEGALRHRQIEAPVVGETERLKLVDTDAPKSRRVYVD